MLTASRVLRKAVQKHHAFYITSTVASTREFHRSAVAYRIPDAPTLESSTGSSTNGSDQTAPSSTSSEGVKSTEPESNDTSTATTSTTTKQGRTRDGYGSGSRRAVRNRKVKDTPDLPPVILPSWFYERNVRFFKQQEAHATNTVAAAAQQEIIAPIDDSSNKVDEQNERSSDTKEIAEATAGTNSDDTEDADIEDPDTITNLGEGHHIDNALYRELTLTLRATLHMPPPENIDYKDILRNDTLLKCPKVEGHRFLDLTVQALARDLEADVIRIDAEDIAQIVGGYLGENVAWTDGSIGELGYATHAHTGKMEDFFEEAQEDVEEDDEDGDEDAKPTFTTSSSAGNKPGGMNKNHSAAMQIMNRLMGGNVKSAKPAAFIMGEISTSPRAGVPMAFDDFVEQSANSGWQDPSSASSESWSDLKLTAVLEGLVDAPRGKVVTASSSESRENESSPANSSQEELPARNLIIQIAEYSELKRTTDGRNILGKLKDIVKKRWYDGAKIMAIGTSSIETDISTNSSIQLMQSKNSPSSCRTIFVPPARTHTIEEVLEENESRYIAGVNIRHITDMICKLRPAADVSALDTASYINTKSEAEDTDVICDAIFFNSTVQRIVMFMLGEDSNKLEFTNDDIRTAIEHLTSSDAYKFDWASKERNLTVEKNDADHTKPLPSEKDKDAKEAATRLSRLKKDASKHEKKLLGGIVHASSIRTSYSDVRAPLSTIEALKSLTSLSLRRPEAFSYGILASEKIPGILLYGPPGTGKTLLAKAVAKESGATVLEVSGSEIYDMYVGEGEKNVKAVFTLAKKLSPCVIFIDEADAMFGARGGPDLGGRRSHRELINQFLKELDGMTDFAGILMVATNRPFDLDEAVLRRLPRRILVDLPVEADREAILSLQLRTEILETDVDLKQIAKTTPFYSGSDLKNLSVAAALAAVREENDAATAYAAGASTTPNADEGEKYKYPEKRRLAKRHFEKALEEISASISEDMSTLAAIRKFDERYGDRKGRRKKGAGLGFGGPGEGDKEGDGRVRGNGAGAGANAV